MSVATPIIDYIDGATRRIYLKQGVSDYYPIEDLYHEYRNLRRTDDELRKWEPLLKAEGNVPKGAGAFTPRYVVLLLGTKVVPFDENLQINQLGDMITDNPDVDPTLYDISGLTTAKPIFIKPSEAETIQLNSASIEYASYNGQVTVDINNITGKASAGTKHPIGTRQVPSNNLIDAFSIANTVGLDKIRVLGNLELGLGDNFERFEFVGDSATKTIINILPSANVLNCEFTDCTISGTLDGNSEITHARISALDFVDGKVEYSDIGPDIIKLGTSTNANLFSCFSTVPGGATPVIDMNGGGILGLRDYNGGIELRNYTGTGAHSIDMSSGQIKLDPNTITGGTFVCRGVGKLVDAITGIPIKTGTWNGTVTIINEMINLTTIGEAAVFSEAVYISVNGVPGTTNPIGLSRTPVNNLADAIQIATDRGTRKFVFLSDFTIPSTTYLVGYTFWGTGWQNQTLTFEAGCIVAYCDIHELTITGYETGITSINDCRIAEFGSVGLAPSSQDVILKRCLMAGPVILPSNYSGTIITIDCYSDVAEIPYTLLDMGNSTANIVMRNYSGQIEITNMTQGNIVDISFSGGEMKLRTASVTNGIIHALGNGIIESWPEEEHLLTGLWNGGVQIYNETVNGQIGFVDSVWTEEEKEEVIQYSKNASDNAEQTNLKL